MNCWKIQNGQSAAKPRTEEGSTTIPKGSTLQAIGSGSGGLLCIQDEDIVYSIQEYIAASYVAGQIQRIQLNIKEQQPDGRILFHIIS